MSRGRQRGDAAGVDRLAHRTGPNPQFAFTSNICVSFECQLAPTETEFTACVSPKAYTTLAVSAGYTFSVRAKDSGGAVDTTPATRNFSVSPGPTINITAPANNATVGTSFMATFTTETNVTYSCQVDALTAVSCTPGQTFTGLSAGTHTFQVTGTDTVTTLTATQQIAITVDATGPGVTIMGTPGQGDTVNTFTANYTFTPLPTNEPTPFTFECKLDGAATFTSCPSGFTASGLAAGSHSLQVQAKDRFGNIGTVVTRSWTAVNDTTGPDVVINGAPANAATVNSTSASFTFTPNPSGSDSPYTYECKFDAAANFGSCTAAAAFSVSNLIQGSHTLQVRAKDKFGNYGNTISRTWTITVFSTTINSIRTGIPSSVPIGTRVQIGPGSGPRP
ncbi:MAG: hypothetical protein ACT4TC_18140 [Myxococcaceae bacterium]